METVKWFGKKGSAQIYDHCPKTETPIGVLCTHCTEPILYGEDGFLDSVSNPFHKECWLRLILGSVAHQSGTCACFKGEDGEDDPEGLTPRQAAKLAYAYLNADKLPVN